MWFIPYMATATNMISSLTATCRLQCTGLGQVLRFAGVGVAATLTHILVALLTASVFALAPLLSNFAGFSVAVAVSFWGHLRITFQVQNPRPQHFYRFVTLSIVSLIVSSLLTASWIRQGGDMLGAMGLVAIVVPGLSFLAARLWTFVAIEHPPTGSGPHQSDFS